MSTLEHFMGEIVMFGGNYPPAGWAFCDGATLDIAQHNVLYAVIGTIYGGDGRRTFNLPNLKGRFPIHRGNQFIQGYSGGYDQMTLTKEHMPEHTHSLMALPAEATTQAPTNNVLADPNSRLTTTIYSAPVEGDLTQMNQSSIGNAGGSTPIPLLPPFTSLNFIICLDGIFPSRN